MNTLISIKIFEAWSTVKTKKLPNPCDRNLKDLYYVSTVKTKKLSNPSDRNLKNAFYVIGN